MRTLHVPVFDANAYQELLFEALASHGVKSVAETRAVPFTPFAHQLWNADALHLHWLHPYFLFGSVEWLYRMPFSRLICRIASWVFVLQVALAQRFTRVVWTAHNLTNHENRYEHIDHWVTEQVARRADVIQVWDEHTRDELCRRFDISPNKVVAIPHGNYIERYERTDRQHARTELELPEDQRVYLSFGAIRPYKGVPDLVRAFKDIDGLLVIAGNPKYDALERELYDLAASRDDIRLDLGYVPNDEVSTYFAAADVAVFSYRDIFNSGSVVLAMSLARPVVAPAKGSIPSVLPPENIVYDDLRTGLRETASKTDAELRATGERNLTAAHEEHDWDDVARQTIELYHPQP